MGLPQEAHPSCWEKLSLLEVTISVLAEGHWAVTVRCWLNLVLPHCLFPAAGSLPQVSRPQRRTPGWKVWCCLPDTTHTGFGGLSKDSGCFCGSHSTVTITLLSGTLQRGKPFSYLIYSSEPWPCGRLHYHFHFTHEATTEAQKGNS